MPYSVAWNEAIPAGTSAANQLATFITNDKIAVRERIDSLFGTSGGTSLATADPYKAAKFVMGATATSSIVPGATSQSLRNAADNADNVLVLDNGNTTIRGLFNSLKAAKGAQDAAAGYNIDLSSGNSFIVDTSTGGTFSFTNPVAGTFYLLMLSWVGGTGNPVFPASVKFPAGVTPTFTRTIGRADIVSLYYTGSVYIATVAGQNYTP